MSNEDLHFLEKELNSSSEPYDPDSRDDIVDPRVQIELERLNTATDLINKFEIELDEARSNFRQLLSESSLRVNQLAKKLGVCVEKARPYYEARMQAKQLKTQTQKAALRYERASSAHSVAKEMVYLAEEGLKKEGRCFDPAWQEMLNHATLRVNEAESERVVSQHEHLKTSSAYNDVEKVVQQLHQELKKSIVKSSLSTRRSLLQLNNLANQHQLQLLPYFEMKAQFNQLLEEQRRKVHRLEENVLKIKMNYADALHNLEEISDEIHQRRKLHENEIANKEKGDNAEIEPSNYTWENFEAPFHHSTGSSTSCDDIFGDNLTTDEMYMSLPSKLKGKSRFSTAGGIAKTQCLRKNSSLPETSWGSSEFQTHSKAENMCMSFNGDTKDATTANAAATQDANFISKQLKYLNISSEQCAYPIRSPDDKDGSPEEEKLTEHGFLVADLNILRVQREEISDSESLASNDTADTLDDNQIECLLLDKVLPQDVQEVPVLDLGNQPRERN